MNKSIQVRSDTAIGTDHESAVYVNSIHMQPVSVLKVEIRCDGLDFVTSEL